MRFKLIALDVDGTLLNSQREIGPRTKACLQSAEKAGIKTVLCTGRRYRSTLPIIEMLGSRPMVVVNGGSLVKDSATNETIYRNGLPFLLAEAILVFLRAYNVSPILFLDTFPVGPDFVVEDDTEGCPEYLRYVRGGAGYYGISEGFRNVAREKILEIAIFGKYKSLGDLMHRIKLEFRRRITTHVLEFDRYQHKSDCLEILHADTSKWNALSHVAEKFGITDQEIIAIGDDINDLEMIQKAGFGVAMGNAREDLKDVAKLVTGTCDEEGVADVLEQLLGEA